MSYYSKTNVKRRPKPDKLETQALALPLIALVGNPNTGKTTLFNGICRTHQKTANYPGTTIEKKLSSCQLGNKKVGVVDLPGLYSLEATAYDENISRQCLLGELEDIKKPQLIIFTLDATNLRRNLFLYSQLSELNIPIIVGLTMHDQITKANIDLDIEQLQKQLQVPVIILTDYHPQRIENLKTAISNTLKGKEKQRPPLYLTKQRKNTDKSEANEANKSYPQQSLQRFRWIDSILRKVNRTPQKQHFFSNQKWDYLFTHRFGGLLIFGGIMYLMFYSIYAGAQPAMEGIEYALEQLSSSLTPWLPEEGFVRSLVQDGIIGGVGAVLVFLPQIVTLFLFISLLEDSGYLVRAAFLVDRLFSWAGLNGRSFIPLLSSFACAIPGIMAARAMPEYRARLYTILIAPLMSCSARLPIYVLMIGAIIEPRFGAGTAILCLFFMHALGPLIALPLVHFLNYGFLHKGNPPKEVFFMEFPPYRKPHFYNVYRRISEAAKKFLVKAGTLIFVFSLIIWFLAYFPRTKYVSKIPSSPTFNIFSTYKQLPTQSQKNGNKNTINTKQDKKPKAIEIEHSYLGQLGKFMAPLFSPLGFDWKITIAVLSAFPAREVLLSTLGIIYNADPEHEEQHYSLRRQLYKEQHPNGKPVYTVALSLSLMVFFALCSQCMSTLAIIYKELGHWKWPVFVFIYMTSLAWVGSFLVYQSLSALGL